jgi:hypothetical protein
MEKYSSKLIDKLVFYTLSMICPFLTLIIISILNYEKDTDDFLDRIKLISIYEIFNGIIIIATYKFSGIEGLKITILILVIFYSLLCGIQARRKKDYFSRGFFLGLLSCHFCLAIINTSDESTARINNEKWPDIGLSVLLMLINVIYIIIIYLIVKYWYIKITDVINENMAVLHITGLFTLRA